MNRIRSSFALSLVFLLATLAIAQTRTAPVKPGKIYVGSMGMGADADELRIALGYELQKTGFKVVDFEPQSDTVLTGLIVTRVEEAQSSKRVTVFLKNRHTGKMVWNQDFGSTYSAAQADVIRRRAQEIAQKLKKDSAPAKRKTAGHV
jgi:hypothetical protein